MTQREARTAFYLFLPLSLTLLAASIVVAKGPRMPLSDEAYDQIELFTRVSALIESKYVDEVDTWDLLYAGLRGMTKELDHYSAFYPPVEGKRFSEETHRQYYGVGFSVRNGAPPLTIDYLFRGSPAERVGLQAGDRIIAVDGLPIDPEDIGAATARIKGPLGTRVKLTIEVKATGETKDFTVPRAQITQPTVFDEHFKDPHGRLRYLRVGAFGENTATEFDQKLKEIRTDAEAGQVDGLILDLRFNQGGLVPSCRLIANRFLKAGVIFGIRARDSDDNETKLADPDECWLPDLPLVVLINRYSASAAEILAGALQDHKRALLVGERSFGKGVVQSVYELKVSDDDTDERTAVLKFTTSVYLTPSGRVIEKSLQEQEAGGGLQPDLKVDLSAEKGALVELDQRFTLLEIPARYRAEVLASRGQELPDGNDRQLEAAVRVLHGETIAQDL